VIERIKEEIQKASEAIKEKPENCKPLLEKLAITIYVEAMKEKRVIVFGAKK